DWSSHVCSSDLESWIRVVLNPHHEQRTTRRVSATSTTSFSITSTSTAITRMRRRCRRTDIASGSIRAPSLLGDFDITEYRGALTLRLALLQSERLPNSTRSLDKSGLDRLQQRGTVSDAGDAIFSNCLSCQPIASAPPMPAISAAKASYSFTAMNPMACRLSRCGNLGFSWRTTSP